MGKHNPLFCKWCKKQIEGKGWSDGPARYCNHRCFSAQTFWLFVGCSLFLIPFTIILLVYPDLLAIMLLPTAEDPVTAIAESMVLMVMTLGIFVAIFLTTIGISYSAYVGFIERRNMKKQDSVEQPHTQYFD